jgi:hypothetical protein
MALLSCVVDFVVADADDSMTDDVSLDAAAFFRCFITFFRH